MSLTVEINAGKFFDKIRDTQSKLRASLEILARTGAQQMEAYAKTNARWTDRTSNARQLLKGDIRWEGDALIAAISHNVDYGIWLELCHERKYAILEEAMLSKAQELLESYSNILNKVV